MANRWWIYQKERFPVFAHAPLVLAFSLSAVTYSAQLRGEMENPAFAQCVCAFGCALLFFLQLRIADEFKDFAEDSRHRPYRPVPRGLVTLKELGLVGAAAAFVQLLLCLIVGPALIGVLVLTWSYLALMSREFFADAWLRARPFTYMWTHMLIMPLIDFFATACDWLAAQASPPAGLWWFLATSFFNGMVIEIGRKIRVPEDEEEGVQTYSRIWGMKGAARAWLAVLALTAYCGFMAAGQIHFAPPFFLLAASALAIGVWTCHLYYRHPVGKSGKNFELVSAIWTVAMYLGLGILPFLVRR
jgi:4-hydroxybenzoate polyprenyltransferase